MKDLFAIFKYPNVGAYMFIGLSIMVFVASFLNLLPEQLMGYVINVLSGHSEQTWLGSRIDSVIDGAANHALIGLALFFCCSALAAIFNNFYGAVLDNTDEGII